MNIHSIRKDFPVTQNCIYLDSGAKSALAVPVYNAICSFYQSCFETGRDYAKWWEMVDTARERISKIICADPNEIAFFASSTQAANVVAQGIQWNAGDNILVAEDEFPSNLYPWLSLKEKGVDIRLVHAEDGDLSLSRYKALVDSKTRLIAVSHVQAGTGYRINLEEFGEFCKKAGIIFFVDATQSCGVFEINVKRSHIDFLCASTYKWLLGTDGLAFLYGRGERQSALDFVFRGWAGREIPSDYSHHEFTYPDSIRRFELGNHNFSAICALNAGVNYLLDLGTENAAGQTLILVNELKNNLKTIAGIRIVGDYDSEHTGALVTITATSQENSRIHQQLLSNRIITTLRPNGIRFSPYFYNTDDEIAKASECLRSILKG